ncbi:hypothetical protein HGRIS_007679 [Hohenbuehelia grisea]|uniref:Uncharacterized protein n=1 Tax=Hohenbuehelia grisea TaxID=104357 RepID=A0ABR3J600_9AGAR
MLTQTELQPIDHNAWLPHQQSQRRRSSAAHRPAAAGPPPTQPIPSIPQHPPSPSPPTPDLSLQYARPGASAGLAAVAAFSSRQAASQSPSPSPGFASTPSHDSLSDPPPRSLLQSASTSSSSPSLMHMAPPIPPHHLLTPPEPRSATEQRPSSRRALMRALELAREAVSLDSTNDDPVAAVAAYGRSVALLSEVMERVRRGEDSTETSSRRRSGRRRSIVAQEEEVRRLKSIHDTYADRMNILSLIYSIPPMPHTTASIYSTMTVSSESTQPGSPTSISPTSDAESNARASPSGLRNEHWNDQHTGHDREHDSTAELLGNAMFGVDSPESPGVPTIHPYAAPPVPEPPARFAQAAPPVPTSIPTAAAAPSPSRVRRARSGSTTLPPQAPPPTTLPPPAPVFTDPFPDTAASQVPSKQLLAVNNSRQRGDSVGHRRTDSGGRLAALPEEHERYEEGTPETEQSLVYRKNPALDGPKTAIRDSHPLPPLPPPSASNSIEFDTPRTSTIPDKAPPSPRMPVITPRQRGVSQPLPRTDSSGNMIINASTNQGTIHQRRSKVPISSTTPRSSSPSGSTASAGSLAPSKAPTGRQATASLPSIGVAPVVTRNRALSQPDRRPNGRVSPDPPPLPISAGGNVNYAPRKTSFPPKHVQVLTLQTDVPLSASLPTAASLVPPPPVLSGNLPTTPPSPLPPLAPTDPLRKPYHLMHLLLTTMTSSTGGYITRRLHVPQEVWSQGGAKLDHVPDKVRVVEILHSALEELQVSSSEYFGAGNVSSGMGLGIGSVTRKESEAWVAKLEEFSAACDTVVQQFGRKLGVGEGFAVKKSTGVSTWGNKLTRRLDKFTNGKNLDSPAAYVAGLRQLFAHAQLLDEHTKAAAGHPMAPAYAAFPADLRGAAEAKLRRASEFFARVVLTFVVCDLSQLLDKYAKKCEKWLAE